jgi:poly(3-hydroxybutyrate) depolymerase
MLGFVLAAALQSYTIDPNKVFVAGISSGGAMAAQIHIAYSALFKGAAVYAGVVDDCAQDDVERALRSCGPHGYGKPLDASEAFIDAQAAAGAIDPASDLAGQPVYLWSGTHDRTVPQQAVDDLAAEYAHYGAVVTYDNAFPAQHGWESPDGPNSCGHFGSPYIIACDRDGAAYDSEKTWLTLFFGPLQPRNDGTLSAELTSFDQHEFGRVDGMDGTGWIFVPQSCTRGARCGLVVALGGCMMGQHEIGTTFAHKAGINEWADTNGIIVLYPYQTATDDNPKDCWDWWGYTNDDYALKRGPQMTAIVKMVRRLMGGKSP